MPQTVQSPAKEITYVQAIRDALREEMLRDERVFLLGQDIGVLGGAFKATEGLFEEFGDLRVHDTPICESAMVGMAIGAALMGLRPVVEMQFADFIACAMDQIVNEAATLRYRYGGKVGVPLVVRAPSGGGVHGGIFHSQSREAWFTHTPGLKVVMPATPCDAKGLLKAAIRDDDPVVFFEPKYLYRSIKEVVPEGDYIVPLGEAKIVREGADLTVITYGLMLGRSLAAARKLEEKGIEAEVIDLRTLKPIDWDLIKASVRKTSKVMVVHEASRICGLGAELAAVIAEELFDDLDGPVVRVTTPDVHVPFSPPLEEFVLPNENDIFAAGEKLAAY